MAEKNQENLRLRLGPRLLKRLDAARAKTGRTRTDEIEARLQDSFKREDMYEIATLAGREMLASLKRDAAALERRLGRPPTLDEILTGENLP